MSSRNISQLSAVMILLAAAGLGVGGVLVWNATQDSDHVVGGAGVNVTAQTTVPGIPPTPIPSGATTPAPDSGDAANPVPVEPTPVPEPPVSTASADIDDALIEAVMAQAAASPLVGLPGRDEIATVRLVDQFRAAGYDLNGLDFSIYPASSADSFVLVETSDSTPLLASESGEAFITDLLGSPILSEYEVERLVLQHESVDEQGSPVLVTMTILVSDFEDAINTGADVFSLFAVQMEPR